MIPLVLWNHILILNVNEVSAGSRDTMNVTLVILLTAWLWLSYPCYDCWFASFETAISSQI